MQVNISDNFEMSEFQFAEFAFFEIVTQFDLILDVLEGKL